MKSAHLALICAALAAVFSAEAVAAVYKWVDKNGNVIYGDQPPPDKTAQSKEINTSAVPLALQERLRQLDRGFTIKRITGNIDVAWVCLEYSISDRYEPSPAFVSAFNSTNLGTIQPGAMVQDNVQYNYDANGRLRSSRNGTDRCPEHQADTSGMIWGVFEIHFDPKAVVIYRGAP